jgi:hypothetical protein
MLSEGEITEGMLITVLKWTHPERVRSGHMLGDPYRVLAVSLPYIRLKATDSSLAFSLDTRNCDLMELDTGFIDGGVEIPIRGGKQAPSKIVVTMENGSEIHTFGTDGEVIEDKGYEDTGYNEQV